jgi:hypothetical protein
LWPGLLQSVHVEHMQVVEHLECVNMLGCLLPVSYNDDHHLRSLMNATFSFANLRPIALGMNWGYTRIQQLLGLHKCPKTIDCHVAVPYDVIEEVDMRKRLTNVQREN